LHSDEKITIDTPEQIALELPLAGIGSRSLALVIDSLLQLAAGLLIFFMISVVLLALGTNVKAFGVALLVLIPFLFHWGYFALFEIIWNGQTPGKRIAKIRVIKESGRPITPVEAIGRNLVRAIDMLPGVYAVGLLCMIFSRRNKRLGDYVAGTISVHEKAIEKVSTIWNLEGSPAEQDPDAAKVTSDQLVLIETYLNRRRELDPLIRIKTAEQIVAMIRDKTGIVRGEGQTDDIFLETLARKVRDTARYR